MELVIKHNGDVQETRKEDDYYGSVLKAIADISYLSEMTGIDLQTLNESEDTEINSETQTLTLAQRISELEELALDIAEIEVESGNLDIEDVPENLQEQIRSKLDESQRLEK